MKRFIMLMCLFIAGLNLIPVTAQDATAIPALDVSSLTAQQFTNQTDPIALVGAYYNAISRREYQRAYSYWEQAPLGQTEPQFEAGFADTLSGTAIIRLPIFVDAGAGNLHASIPTFVIAQHTNGTQTYYAGCLVAHKTNVPVGNATQPDPNWYLSTGTIRQLLTPNLSSLDTACGESDSLPPQFMPLSQTDPAALVESYASALASGNPAGAASYWENPPGDLFYAQFYTLFTTASAVHLYINPLIFSDAGAGNIYAAVPTLVTTTYPNGALQFVAGCLTTHKANVPVGNATEPDPNWHLRDMSMTVVPTELAAIYQVAQGCNT